MFAQSIRFVSAKGGPLSIQLLCRVKPGVSADRHGIESVTHEAIDVCVMAQKKNGEANNAVRQVIADALTVAKTDVGILKGKKSKHKTISVDVGTGGMAEDVVDWVRWRLVESIRR
jgi:uncharacterized protein YggU (UPF0235/DUF167 family)